MALNFRGLGRKRAARNALLLGIGATALLLAGMLLLPAEIVDRIPNPLLSAIYVPLCALWARQTQGPQIAALLQSRAALSASGWATAGVGIGAAIMVLAVSVGGALSTPPFGFGGKRVSCGPAGMHDIHVRGTVDRATVDRLFETLDTAGFVPAEFGVAYQIRARSGQYELTIPSPHESWTDAEFMRKLHDLKTAIETGDFATPITIVLYDEDLRRSYRKVLE